jgi:predicted nucleic acid-binding Zn ribbon protein
MIYVYSCECGSKKEEFRKVRDRNKLPKCDKCGINMVREIGGHNVVADIESYYDENLETGIKSRKHRERVMREKGVYEKFGKGWI